MKIATPSDPQRIATRSVISWRTQQLKRAGYEPEAARQLAERADVDLHVAVDLLRNGCSPDVALRILL